ncbi:MAG TPA: hypothetical protein VGM73_00955 [Candidatus Didemnitutus sp.]|jgi:hypothetical protein
MKSFEQLSASEAARFTGGDGPATPPPAGITTQSNVFYDLFYMVGAAVGAVVGGFVAFVNSSPDPYSVVEWKTGIRTAK